MQIKRVIEVWEKGMNGTQITQWPVAKTITPAFLLHLFSAEQRVPDPDMLLSYFLRRNQVSAIQPYVAQEMDTARYDFILAAYGQPEARELAHCHPD